MIIGHMFQVVGKPNIRIDFILEFLVGQNWSSDTDKEFEHVDIQNKHLISSPWFITMYVQNV
jgi:hypothetical protein